MELNMTADSDEDLLFEDLQRQISLMIEEEDEFKPKSHLSISNNPSPFPLQLSSYQYPVWSVNARWSSPSFTSNQPNMDLNQVCQWRVGRRECNGTGVFIPRCTGLTRKSKAEKSNNLGASFRDKLYKQVDNS